MSIEAMRQALEALETLARYENPETRIQARKPKDGGPIVTMYPHKVASDTATALRTAIEQAGEPVAWMYVNADMPTNRQLEWTEERHGYAGNWRKYPLYVAPPAAQEPVCEVLNERGEVDYISYVPPVGTPLYTAPQSINEFKPDWDTVKAYDEKFAEMLDEQQRLRAELKRTEQRLHDVATLCANVEAQAAITQGVLKAVNTAAMKLTADLTCMEIDNDDRLDRDRVMERVMRWRNEWDKAMFEYRPKRHDPIVGTKTWFSEDGKIIQQELRQSSRSRG